ncbi:hypothetical protein PTTG_04267 [Puccinia triticina 1-1 BBBD Race 1]|uniref:Uncharacterized protein n=1 Tax=Puccinia triticina (isolate 1-1 / race 1 (BBBD)) TaxID=630390 RepID=A0A180GHY8_PUCT1|nr:hypothetical protein PTTG_04267 [Puccinia triticina 1-1 BBBD Race 1]
MSQTLFLEAPPTQTLSGFKTTDSRMQPGMPTALELHRLELLRAASHHLPSIPPRNHWDCLAFRQISHRLIGWDRLYSERTGEEFIFQNYFEESPFGPELLYAIYPRLVLNWNHSQVLSDTIIFSNLGRHPDQRVEEQQDEDYQSNETSTSCDATDSSIIHSDDSHGDEGQELVLPNPFFLPLAPLSIQPMVQIPAAFQFERHSQPGPVAHHPITTSSSSIPRCRKSHRIESACEPMIDFKRRKIQPA